VDLEAGESRLKQTFFLRLPQKDKVQDIPLLPVRILLSIKGWVGRDFQGKMVEQKYPS
jgi:hypothetical protein